MSNYAYCRKHPIQQIGISSLHPENTLAQFVATLSAEQVPADVQRRAEELFLDRIAAALAGKGSAAAESILRFTRAMGPADGAPSARPATPPKATAH